MEAHERDGDGLSRRASDDVDLVALTHDRRLFLLERGLGDREFDGKMDSLGHEILAGCSRS